MGVKVGYRSILLLGLLIALASAVHAVQYADCDAPGLDTGGKTCIEVSNCAALNDENAYYLLTTDFYWAGGGTCFDVNDKFITIDLNEHTITFTTAGKVVSTFTDQWFNGSYLEVKNGKIIQDSASGMGGAQLGLIDLAACEGCKIHHMTLVTESFSYPNIALHLPNTGTIEIYNNDIYRNDKTVNNEHSNVAAINTYGIERKIHVIIHDNNITGRPWLFTIGGKRSNAGKATIYNNNWYPQKYNRNPYALILEAPGGGEIYNNTIISDNSRGISIQGSTELPYNGYLLHDNYIDVSEELIDGVDGAGTHALRIRPYPEPPYPPTPNNQVYNNVIIARTKTSSYAYAGFLSDWHNTSVYNNTFIAMSHDGITQASAVAVEGEQTYGGVFFNNTMISNYHNIELASTNNGIDNGRFISNKFIKYGTYPSYAAYVIGYCCGMNVLNNTFLDSTFLNGSSINDMHFGSGGDGGGEYSYNIEWYLNLSVVDELGQGLNGAQVSIVNSKGDLVYSGTSTVGGRLDRIELRQFTRSGHYEAVGTTSNYDYFTPHTVTVNYQGQEIIRPVTMDMSKIEIFEFATGSLPSTECTEGEINSACLCGNANYTAGYCCNTAIEPVWFDPDYESCPSGTYYIVDQAHPNADDTNAGTDPDAPWEHAWFGAEQLNAGDVLVVKAGQYYRNTGTYLEPGIRPLSSGTESDPIVIKAYPGDDVYMISGDTGNVPTLSTDIMEFDNAAIGTSARDEEEVDYIIIDGFKIYGSAQLRSTSHSVIKNCEMYGGFQTHHYSDGVGMNVLRIENTHDCLVRNNILHNNYRDDFLIIGYDSWDLVIENNEFYHESTDPSHETYAIFFKDHPERMHVRYNVFRDNPAAAIWTSNQDQSQDVFIYQNLFVNNGYTELSIDHKSAIDVVICINNVQIYNNVFVNNRRGIENLKGASDGDTPADPSDDCIAPSWSSWNNIFYDTTDYHYKISEGSYISHLTYSDRNNYYKSSGSNEWDYIGPQTGLGAWQSLSSLDSNSIESNPMFEDVSRGDYHLQSGSPALGLGVDRQDHDNDGNTGEAIPAGMYISGGEVIGLDPLGVTTEIPEVVCTIPYDQEPCDVIDFNELIAAINGWFASQIDIPTLIEIIRMWKQ